MTKWISLCILLPNLFLGAQDFEINEEMRLYVLTFEVRVIDAGGRPILDLNKEDFLIKHKGEGIHLVDAEWISQIDPPESPADSQTSVSKTKMPKFKDYIPPDSTRQNRGAVTYRRFLDGDYDGRKSSNAPIIDDSISKIETKDPNQKKTVVVEPEPIPEMQTYSEMVAEAENKQPPPDLDGRLIVFYVQNDIGSYRNTGLMRMIPRSKKFIDGLTPRDYVAVFSFDSHLKMHMDFSRDHEQVKETIGRLLAKIDGKIIEGGPFPSIADKIDFQKAKDTADTERAVKLIADAMIDMPGSKSLVYLGFGMGWVDESGLKQNWHFDNMVAALNAADMPVYALDLTYADYHTLEIGLKRAAANTGGLYYRTSSFADSAIQSLLYTLSGFYRLSIQVPSTVKDPDIKIKLKKERRGRILVQKSYRLSSK